LLEVLPADGSSLGNLSAREALGQAVGREISEEAYEDVKGRLLAKGLIRKGRGRGGAIALAEGIEEGSRVEASAAAASPAPAMNGRRAKKEAPAKDFKAVLWASADKLRAQMDAAEYKHLVLGLIFLKYISDTFAEHRSKVLAMVSLPDSDFYMGDDPADHEAALEDRDYYTQENVFWVPAEARWESLRARAKQSDIGRQIDQALVAIENENPTLRGKLDKRFGAAQLEPGRLGELVDLISTIGFADEQRSGDVLGEVYEYFLGQFASAEGKKGGQFYTPAHVVKTLVAVLAPHKGRIYDPCCGSGGMFVQSEKFIQAHGGKRDDALPPIWARNRRTPSRATSSPIRNLITSSPTHRSTSPIGAARNMRAIRAGCMAGRPWAMPTMRGCSTCSGSCGLVGKRAWCWPMAR
jgi:hypothetical protein